MAEDLSELLDEIRDRIQLLESNLPQRIDSTQISLRAKLPFHVIQCREGLAWRLTELSRDAYEAIRRERLVSAILLTRGVVETAAAAWYLQVHVNKAIDSKRLDGIKSRVSRLLLGCRTDPDMPQAINVLDFVDAVDKEVEGFRKRFDHLCEFAHPNWAGTSLLYSKPSLEQRAVEFGRNMREFESVRLTAVVNLNVALNMFEVAYNGIADVMASFVELCERQLEHAV